MNTVQHYKALNNLAPQYLIADCQLVAVTGHRCQLSCLMTLNVCPVWARGNPPYPVISLPSSLPLVSFLFSLSYSCFICLLAFHPFPFYQNSPTPFPRPDVVGGDLTWL